MTNPPRPPGRPSLGSLMLLIAAGTVGFWLVLPLIRETVGETSNAGPLPWLKVAWALAVGLLGGLSLVGPPLLMAEARRQRRRWGPGRFWWFAQGTATWLMWPPIVFHRARAGPSRLGEGSMTEVCYLYGTPMMGLYVGLALLAGGRQRRRLRGRFGVDGRERFGRVLGLLWALVGVGVLVHLYLTDFGIVR